jgi:ATP-dependent DNA helicase RecQ
MLAETMLCDPAQVLRQVFGFPGFRGQQDAAVRHMVDGGDALVLMPTGGGKSICYQVPALVRAGTAVIVSPLIALMDDQVAALRQVGVNAGALHSEIDPAEARSITRDLIEERLDLLYVSPERLLTNGTIDRLSRLPLALFAVDEAHCVSQWGHDLRPAYLHLRTAIRELGSPPVLALTATATAEVAADITKQLGLTSPELVRTGIDRHNLRLEVRRTVNREAKRAQLLELLAEERGPTIVYTATTKIADEVYSYLATNGESVGRYHGKLGTRERKDAQTRFMSGELRVMVATKAFGMGIDKHDLRMVVHWHLPDSLESYVQEAGRAGRDGLPSRAVLFYRVEDKRIQSFFLGGKYPSRADSKRIYDAVVAADKPLTTVELADKCDLAVRRTKVVVALLESTGILEIRKGRLRAKRLFANEGEVEAFLVSYANRHRGDHSRLEAVVHYGQSTACRGLMISAYFGELTEHACGHCDNCHSGAADAAANVLRANAEPRRAKRPLVAAFSVQPGERVRHETFGIGDVIGVDGQSVTVAFPSGEQTVRASWLATASARELVAAA